MGLILLAINVLIWIIIIDAILSWIPSVDRRNQMVVLLRAITEPIYRPIRKMIPPNRTGYIDLSPLIAVVGLQVLAFLLRIVR